MSGMYGAHIQIRMKARRGEADMDGCKYDTIRRIQRPSSSVFIDYISHVNLAAILSQSSCSGHAVTPSAVPWNCSLESI